MNAERFGRPSRFLGSVFAGATLAVMSSAAATGAAPASAATVQYVGFPACIHDFCTYTRRFEYVSEPGELNRLTIAANNRQVTFRDTGAPIAAEGRCAAVGSNEVVCTAEERGSVSVSASMGDGADEVALDPVAPIGADVEGGEGDDRLDLSLAGGYLSGGEGNDTLLGGKLPSTLKGGPGADDLLAGEGATTLDGELGDDVVRAGAAPAYLAGGGGVDTLVGGPGNDTLTDGDGGSSSRRAPVGADLIDGGGGSDMVVYDRYHDPSLGVHVDLADPAPDGYAGEGDVLRGLENVRGGPGPDLLIGDDGGNVLLGADGDDVLVGGGGADALTGGNGFDHLDGGAGDDAFASGEDAGRAVDRDEFLAGYGERLTCGAGQDSVGAEGDRSGPDAADYISEDCEVVFLTRDTPYYQPRPHRHSRVRMEVQPVGVDRRAGRITFAAECLRAGGVFRACGGTLTLARRQRGRALQDKPSNDRLGTTTFALQQGRRGFVTVPLSRGGRAYLARPGAAAVQVQLRRRLSRMPGTLSQVYAYTTTIGN